MSYAGDGNCETCRWWWPADSKVQSDAGQCRRYALPPRAQEWEEDGQRFTPNWPTTFSWEGCGDYTYEPDASPTPVPKPETAPPTT